MNEKGQMTIMSMFMVFMAIIVGLVLFGPIAAQIAGTTDTQDTVNETITLPAVNGTLNLNGKELPSGFTEIYNATNVSQAVDSGEFEILNNQLVNGELTAQVKTLDGATFAEEAVNVTYTYEPDTYIDNAGGRSMAGLILIFLALVIVVATIPDVRNFVTEAFGR